MRRNPHAARSDAQPPVPALPRSIRPDPNRPEIVSGGDESSAPSPGALIGSRQGSPIPEH